MKKNAFFALLFAVFLFSGCKKDDATLRNNFTLTFRASYDGGTLEKYVNYPYGDQVVQFNKFNTYLSNITLIKGSEEIKLSDIEWVDFTPDFAPDDKAVDVTFKYTAPEGDYTGVRIGYGVKPELNAKGPADFPPGHPLNLESQYWTGWKSYLFTNIQGEVDLDDDGTTETIFFYHCAGDSVYNEAAFPQNIQVAGNTSMTIEFDLKKMFTFDGQLLDLSDFNNRTTSHDPSNVVLSYKMMNNFKNATVLK